jgi:hypothetical protein
MSQTATATAATQTEGPVRIPTRRYRLLRGTIARREHAAAHRDASTGKINDQYLNGTTVVYCAYDPERENSAGNIIDLTDDEAAPYLDANPPRVELVGGAGSHRVPPRQHPMSGPSPSLLPPPAPAPVPAPTSTPAQAATGDVATEPDSDPMVGILYGMNVPAAIELVNGMETVVELEVALTAERLGRNRKAVKDAIIARIPDDTDNADGTQR